MELLQAKSAVGDRCQNRQMQMKAGLTLIDSSIDSIVLLSDYGYCCSNDSMLAACMNSVGEV
jgi:hypothetical protein